jgi:acyl phosphate:glycerol-3-phosphate acyltransferase
MTFWQTIACAVLAYLFGSVSFAWIIAKRLKGVDLRTVGSGNLGATNAGRLLGRKWAVVVYVLDFAKGFLPVALLRGPAAEPLAFGEVQVALIAGLAAFAGHCFPIWHQFRGGKGVATGSGVIVGLTPLAASIVIGVFAVVVLIGRRISIASVCAALTLPIAQALLREGPTPRARTATLIVYAAMAAVLIVRHRQNLARFFRGEEPRIGRHAP